MQYAVTGRIGCGQAVIGRKRVSDDVEVWLLFAPFWLLGIAALIGAAWHMGHAARVIRRAQAGGRQLKTSFFSKGLAWHELTEAGRHHLKRALIAFRRAGRGGGRGVHSCSRSLTRYLLAI